MPRIVDHAERRREIAEALWRVVRTQGVGAVSVRSVATEAGWSAGALRHYFATQDELLRLGCALATEQAGERLRSVLAAPLPDPLDQAAAIVEELLPLDDARLGEVLVWLAFTDAARLDPALQRVRRMGWRGTRFVARLAVAEVAGVPPPDAVETPLADPGPEQDARRLHVLVDGWCFHAVSFPEHLDAATLRSDLRAELSRFRRGDAAVP